ncbi:hypothetical protein Rhopal_006192-T1 [Rhodotorula paludigena]|uniref:CWH43-like N-terminal domain-containing protein n=1 Tax=Rhodotorula paludigena TaxID=86838 RepID=A0AAV5GTA9_9BASI|nr:hypothetical protein Rhopal_006192-T1 [Rhodotorula paludigena]
MVGPVFSTEHGRRIGWRGQYWILPLISVLAWFALILTDDAERYQTDQATIVYVSNIGAERQGIFIGLGTVTAVFYILSLLAERWLRHLRRIPGPLRKRDRNADIAACVFGICGAIALILLTCFNAVTHPNGHWACTAIFVVCIALSAICQTLEIWWLKQDHVERKHLRRNAIIKWIIVVFAVACAIAFAATYAVCAGSEDGVPLTPRCDTIKSVAAVLEWVIALLYGVYLCTFGLDLWPAVKTRGHTFDERLMAEDRQNTLHAHKNPLQPGAPGGILGTAEAGALERPSVSTQGEYGAYANPVAAQQGVVEPQMAHVHNDGHGPVTRAAY